MPGVEAADFDCPACGECWTALAVIHPGFSGTATPFCPSCSTPMGTMRCDQGVPALHPRSISQANHGFLRVYGGDATLAALAPRR